DTTSALNDFVADQIGDYQVRLTVSDGQFTSAPASLTVRVIANRKLLTDGTASGMWPTYAGNLSSSKYSPLSQINADNVGRLAVAWRWRSPDNDIVIPGIFNSVFESTPLMVDGVLYTSTSYSQVAAINAATGATLWVYDPASYNSGVPANNGFL